MFGLQYADPKQVRVLPTIQGVKHGTLLQACYPGAYGGGHPDAERSS